MQRVVPDLSIVVPVLNEEDQIEEILRAAIEHLTQGYEDWEILVVDNASTDRTRQRAQPYLDGEKVRYLVNDSNRGKGYSIRRGMLEARGALRLMCDADCSSSLACLPQLVSALEDADVVAGSRIARGAHVGRQQPLRRRFVGFGFLVLTRTILGRLTKDVYCGFKLWTAEAAQSVFERARADGWVFDAEALAIAKRLGYRVREVGIDWNNRSSSRLSITEVAVPAVRELLQSRKLVRGGIAVAPTGERVATAAD